MEHTTNNNIKIVRLQSGEDVMANYYADEENGTVLLDNPMHIIFKRIPTGQTVMMMMPWLPIELIKENNAVIYDSDILTIIEPKEDLINYYGEIVISAQERMENPPELFTSDDEDEDEFDFDEEKEESLSGDELLELLQQRKQSKLH
jgi:hypothetical protein